MNRIYQIGTTVDLACKYDIENLFSENQFDHPRNQNIFYELYLIDFNGDLIDIPVLVNSLQKDAATPNSNSDTSRWQFVRRFFVFDTLSGLG